MAPCALACLLQALSMAEGKYPTAFPLKHAQKDVRLALAAAQEQGIILPVASAANDQYRKVSSHCQMHALSLTTLRMCLLMAAEQCCTSAWQQT